MPGAQFVENRILHYNRGWISLSAETDVSSHARFRRKFV